MALTPNMGLYAWEQGDDPYDHNQLAANSHNIDTHDHSEARGRRIRTESLQDALITPPKIADQAVTTSKYADQSITAGKYAPESVDTTALKNNAVTTPKMADRSVTNIKLAEDILPIGTIIWWWRPNAGEQVPANWEVCDGSQTSDHDFAGGGTITLPNLINKFALGAALSGTGTGTGQPPAIGQQGGSHSANLSHTHTVPHSHTVEGHTHTIPAHVHTVNAHSHTVEAHRHAVDNHSHVVPGHTHPVPAHTHGMYHTHLVEPHRHGINNDGGHYHTFAGGHHVWTRQLAFSGGEHNRQAAYVHAYNEGGGTAVQATMDGAGNHSHGGVTALDSPWTYGPTAEQTDGGNLANTSANAAFSTQAATGLFTQNASPSTSAESPATNAVPLTTNAGSGTTSNDSPVTSSGLGSADVRPAFVGLLPLIKVRR